MTTERKIYNAKLKSSVALEAIIGQRTINEIASINKIHPTQVKQWKKQLQQGIPDIFANKQSKAENHEALISQLYEEIGRLKFELDWVKKKSCQIRLI